MDIANLLKRTEKLTVDNSPAILTAVGVVGTITTAYLTGVATFRAAEFLSEEALAPLWKDKNTPLSMTDEFKLVWKFYIPPVTSGLVTVTAIIYANRIGNRRAAAMAAAYTISERAFSEYKEKVVDKLGEKKERAVRDELAQDRVDRSPVGKTEVIVTGGGDVLCYDVYTGRYFSSSMETLKKAQNDTNYQVLNDTYASLNDFYSRIGLATTKTGEEIGWNNDHQLELLFSTTMSDDSRPCISIDFNVSPVRDYYRLH